MTRKRNNPQVRLWLPRVLFTFIILIGLTFPSRASAANESATVTRITEANARQLLSDAPDRSGGVGDWYLANEYIWAIIDDVDSQTLISPSGGTLLDLGLNNERKPDQFVQMLQLLNMNRDIVIPYDRIQAKSGDGFASVVVSTSHGLRPARDGFLVPDKETAAAIQVETEYRLVSGERFLRVRTTLHNNSAKTARIFNIADIIYWGDDTIKPFAGSEKRLGSTHGTPRGFTHPEIDTNSFVSLLRGMGGFTYIAGGGAEGLPPISYGLCSPTEYNKGNMLWGINDRMVSAVGIFTGAFRRPIDVWKAPFFGIRPGGQFTYERVLVVGGQNDVASATDLIFPLLKTASGLTGVSGTIEPPGVEASIMVYRQSDHIPVTQIRPSQGGSNAGSFRAILPPGDYVAEIHSAERDANPETPALDPVRKTFSVGSGFTDIGSVALPPQARLLIEVKEGNNPIPARVIIRGIDGTPDPDPGSDLLGFTVGNKPTPSSFSANWILLSGNERGPVSVGVRPGHYEVLATHGFEYSVDRKEVVLKGPGEEASVALNLERVIDTPGMMCGDFHVHSIASMDSAFPRKQRILSFVADGVELLIATDHNMLTDYAPTIAALGLEDRITSIVGVEATTMLMLKPTPFTIGHYNVWPLRYDATRSKNGMVPDEGMRPRDLYDRLRQIGDGDILIQVNHGRGHEPDGGASFFHALGTEYDKPISYDASKPLGEYPNNLLLAANSHGVRDIDFDAMEILNGTAYDEYLLLKNDWFSLLNQGFVKTGTANSDTHVKAQLGGYPRNYLLLTDPKAERADERTIVELIRNQRVLCTTGPIIRFTVNDKAMPGDLITPRRNVVSLNVKIDAAPWIPLDEVRIYANGRQAARYPVESESGVSRFDRDIPMTLDQDTWLVVETTTSNGGDLRIPRPPGGLYNIIAPGFVPLAFTNPIFVDVDGNGRFDPPGIPPTPPTPLPSWPIKASVVAAFLAVFFIVGHVRRKRARSKSEWRQD